MKEAELKEKYGKDLNVGEINEYGEHYCVYEDEYVGFSFKVDSEGTIQEIELYAYSAY